MKRNFEIIKNNEIDAMLDEDACKLRASRERLLALNAIFDAALVGDKAKHIAKDIHSDSYENRDDFIRHLLNETSITEH